MAQENIQEQVKVLQSYLGGMAKLVNDLQSRIKSLEEKDLSIADVGTKETVEKQQVIAESISENSNAVKRLEKEIKSIEKDRNKNENNKKEVEGAIKRLDDEILLIKKDAKKSDICMEASELGDKKKKVIRCRYFNYGFCKYKEKCRFVHPKEVCGTYSGGKCEDSSCLKRHPKACKYFRGQTGCKRKEGCDFSHDVLICGVATKDKLDNNYNCAGCKHDWQESQFVVKHYIKNREIFFCLNCEDWIKDKTKVLDHGWSLFDQDGNLKYFV